MKRINLAKWERIAIEEHLKWHPKDEYIKLNSKLSAFKEKDTKRWIINEVTITETVKSA